MKLDLKEAAYWYKADFIRALDGDTVELDVSLGFNLRQRMRFRLLGINTPERKGETKAAGDAARDYLIHLLEPTKGAGNLYVRSYKDKHDKYGGRHLGQLMIVQEDGHPLNVNEHLVEKGHAKPFMEVDW